MTRTRRRAWVIASASTALAVGGLIAWPDQPGILPNRFRIVTYNIRGQEVDLDKLTDYLKSLDADVVFLQESTRRRAGRRSLDVAERIADELDWHCVSATSLGVPADQGCDVAVISRYALGAGVAHSLEPGGRVFAVQTSVETAGPPLHLLSVHTMATYKLEPAHVVRSALTRLAQVRRLLEVVDSIDGDVVIAGDFNTAPWMPAYLLLARDWRDLGAASGETDATYPASGPFLRIDYVFARGDLDARSYRVGASQLSDHLPLVADVELTRAAPHSNGP